MKNEQSPLPPRSKSQNPLPWKIKITTKPIKKHRNSNHKQGKKITAMRSIREVKFQSDDHFPTITGDREWVAAAADDPRFRRRRREKRERNERQTKREGGTKDGIGSRFCNHFLTKTPLNNYDYYDNATIHVLFC